MSLELGFAIPFHTGRALLERAVESVLAQDAPWHALLVRDDAGLEPDVERMLASYGDPRIRYERGAGPPGMVRNFNACLDGAGTGLVTLLHADDELAPGYAGLVHGLAARHPDAVAYFPAAVTVDGDGRPVFSIEDAVKSWLVPGERAAPRDDDGAYTLRGEPALAALMAGDFIFCPAVCFRMARLGSRRFSEEWRQVQDLELWSRLIMEGEALVGSTERAYRYRRHSGTATARQSASLVRFEEELELMGRIASEAERLGWRRASRVAARKSIVRLHLVYRALGEVLRLRGRSAARCLRLALGGGGGGDGG